VICYEISNSTDIPEFRGSFGKDSADVQPRGAG